MPHECTNCGRVFDDGSKEMLSGCPDCGGNKFQFRPSSATADRPTSTPDNLPADSPSQSDRSPDAKSDPEPSSNPETPSATSEGDDLGSDRTQLSRSSKKWPGQDENPQPTDPSPDQTPEVQPETDSDRDAVDPNRDEAVEVDTDGTELSADDSAEDTAQASARSEVVSPDELAAASNTTAATDESPDRSDRPTDADGRVIEPSSDERPDLEDLREELNQQFESIRIVAPGEYELNLMELYDRTEYIISLQEDGRYVIEVPDTWDTTPDSSSDS